MKIAVGLPNAVPDTPGPLLVDWARRAEQLGFSSLGTIGRIVFANHEELVALAAAAGATTRIGLASTVMISPPRNDVLLAKQAATLDSISAGRFSLGVGIGWRDDDYRATGASFEHRGRLLDAQIATMRSVWNGERVNELEPIGPAPHRPGGPELMIGGASTAALARAGRHADAYIAGPLPAEAIAALHQQVATHAALNDRATPRLVASRYFALTDGTFASNAAAEAPLRAYYDFAGPEMVEHTIGGMLRTDDEITNTIAALEALGVDELFLWPTIADTDQLTQLAAIARPDRAEGAGRFE